MTNLEAIMGLESWAYGKRGTAHDFRTALEQAARQGSMERLEKARELLIELSRQGVEMPPQRSVERLIAQCVRNARRRGERVL